VCYTIGHEKSYDQALKDGGNVKLGRHGPTLEEPDDYPGGIVFRTIQDAKDFIAIGGMAKWFPDRDNSVWAVYGLLADWDHDTYEAPDGYRALLRDATFIAPMPQGVLDRLTAEPEFAKVLLELGRLP
jgi:hypothetical protein